MRRNRNDELLVSALMVLVLVGILSFGIWSRVSGPCWMWNWAPAKDIPGRCIMEDK
jgi:hypothetical protein